MQWLSIAVMKRKLQSEIYVAHCFLNKHNKQQTDLTLFSLKTLNRYNSYSYACSEMK